MYVCYVCMCECVTVHERLFDDTCPVLAKCVVEKNFRLIYKPALRAHARDFRTCTAARASSPAFFSYTYIYINLPAITTRICPIAACVLIYLLPACAAQIISTFSLSLSLTFALSLFLFFSLSLDL